jgi:putative membrane protein
MKTFIVYGTAVLALSSAPLLAQVGSGTSGQGGPTPRIGGATQPPTSGGASDQGGSRQGPDTPNGSSPADAGKPIERTGSGGSGDDEKVKAPKKGTEADQATADQQFVTDAAAGGAAEVELGKLAAEKSNNERVKGFAQRMIADHGKAGEELMSIADSRKLTITMVPNEQQKATAERLSTLSGPAFDQAYIQEMMSAHTKDVVKFKNESEDGKDPTVKAFAAKTLPTIEEHMKMVQDIYKELNRGAVGTSGSQPSPR